MNHDVIYVVDDNKLSCIVHSKLISKIDHKTPVKHFSKPHYALAKLRQELKNELSVLLFLDIEMPNMTGLEMLRYLSKSTYLSRGRLQVVFVSSAIQRYVQDKIMNSLMIKGKIDKPLTVNKLNLVLNKKFKNVSMEFMVNHLGA